MTTIDELERQLKIANDTIQSLTDKVNSLYSTIDYRGSLDKLSNEIWAEKHLNIEKRMRKMTQQIDEIYNGTQNKKKYTFEYYKDPKITKIIEGPIDWQNTIEWVYQNPEDEKGCENKFLEMPLGVWCQLKSYHYEMGGLWRITKIE